MSEAVSMNVIMNVNPNVSIFALLGDKLIYLCLTVVCFCVLTCMSVFLRCLAVCGYIAVF